jgi:hypothetical protein
MDITQSRVIGAGLFFIFIFLSGFWLSRSGKPYGTIKLNIHKFIGLGAVVFLAITVYQIHQLAPLRQVEMAASLVTFVFFVVTIISGGLSSIDKAMPAAFSALHKLFPYLTTLSTAVTLYFLLSHKLL